MPAASQHKSMPTLAVELKDLVIAYIRQETVVPLKSLGRFVAFGVAGSVLLSMGLVLLVLAVLRALQTETGEVFDGNWSVAPYVITLLVCVAVAALAAKSINAAKSRKGSPS